MELPNLYDPEASETWWFSSLNAGQSTEDLIQILEEAATPIALARASLLSFTLLDYERQKRFAARALNTTEPEVEAFALAMIALAEWYQNPQLRTAATGQAFVPMLHDALEQLRDRSRTPLAQEAAYRLQLALATHLNFIGHFDAARVHASRALTLSVALGLRQTEQTAMYTLAQSILHSGNLGEAYTLFERIHLRESANVMVDLRATTQRSLLLLYLGNLERALAVIEEAPPDRPDWTASVRQYLRAHAALGWTEPNRLSGTAWTSSLRWQVQVLHVLAQVTSVRRGAVSDIEREETLRGLFEALEGHNPNAGIESFIGWARGFAYSLMGRYHLAFQSTQSTDTQTGKQFLLQRALHTALRLEIAIAPGGHRSDSLTRIETAMRQIFVEAKANHLASCTGLAKIIQRWHPVAAAYLAVMPGSIDSFLELPSCTEPLIRFAERHAEVYGFHLPLYYALEVMLRTFNFDRAVASSVPLRPFKQAPLNSRMIGQRDALEVKREGEPFHRPLIPAAALVYSLIKADERPGSAHRAAALQLRREFGLVPRVSGEYAESETYHLERLLTALCEGELSIAEFDASLQR